MARLQPLVSEIKALTADLTDPKAKSARLAAFAGEEIARVQAQNRQALGRDAPFEVAVDGQRGAPLSSVKPDGVIVADFDLVMNMLEWIGAELVRMSPVLTGQYARSHILLADGVEIEVPGPMPSAEVYTFLNAVPYARKIERGLSPQAPDGVYEALAAVARKRFGNTARIRFTWRSPVFPAGTARGASRDDVKAERATRTPAIVVVPY